MPEIPAQVEVMTRGGKTSIKPTKAGNATLDRMQAFTDELADNPAVAGMVHDVAIQSRAVLQRLRSVLQEPVAKPTPVAGTTAKAS